MRTGSNPEKTAKKISLETNHRVIVVVFIPALTGYYKNSLEVFQLCLQSLINANKGNYSITLVNNGSCKEVSDFLKINLNNKNIDTLISHNTNIGKIDALIGAARGCREDFITLSDSDILFIKNWDLATMNVFQAFNKAGSVSPIPFRHGLFYGTSSAMKEVLFGRAKFYRKEIPENFEYHNKYLTSINWNNEIDDKIKWPIIESNKVKAILGSGHQILTLRKSIIHSKIPVEPSLTLVGGNSEYRYVDEPVDKAGLMRLSTFHNYAFHIGNQVEAWMKDVPCLENFQEKNSPKLKSIKGSKKNMDHRIYIIKKHLIKRLFKIIYRE